jgi:RNase P/RNase MRP subunit p29
MSASDDEEKCDSGREGDVADETENTSEVLEDRHVEGEREEKS